MCKPVNHYTSTLSFMISFHLLKAKLVVMIVAFFRLLTTGGKKQFSSFLVTTDISELITDDQIVFFKP